MAPETISRRQVLSTLGAGGTIAVAGCIGDGDSESSENGDEEDPVGETTETELDSTVTVGVLQDLSGPTGPEFGHQGISGFLSGLGYKQEELPPELPGSLASLDGEQISYDVNDLTFELQIRDTQSNPQQAQALADELLDEGAEVLYGFSNSDSLTRFANLSMEDTDVPVFVGQASTADVTSNSEFCNRRLFRATENNAMSSRTGGVYISQELEASRVALFGGDTRFGRSQVAAYEQIFEEEGVEIVEQDIVGTGFSNWAPKLEAADQQDAEIVVYAMTGETGRFFSVEFATGDYGMRAIGDMPSRLTLEPFGARLDSLAEELGGVDSISRELIEFIRFGPLTDRYHWNQYDNRINDWLIDAQVQQYGIVPDLFTSSAFVSASAVVQAFEQSGEASSDAVTEEVYGMTVTETPKGRNEYEFQTHNNQAQSPMTVAPIWPTESENWPVALQPGETAARVPKEETTIPADHPDMSCDLS